MKGGKGGRWKALFLQLALMYTTHSFLTFHASMRYDMSRLDWLSLFYAGHDQSHLNPLQYRDVLISGTAKAHRYLSGSSCGWLRRDVCFCPRDCHVRWSVFWKWWCYSHTWAIGAKLLFSLLAEAAANDINNRSGHRIHRSKRHNLIITPVGHSRFA